MSGAPPPQPGDLGTDDDPLDIETDVLELLNNSAGVATVENLVGVAADSTSTDGTLVYPTANGAQGVPTDLAVRIDGAERPVTAIEYADATGTLRPVTEWHLGPLGEFLLTLDSLTFVQPATFDVAVASTTSPVEPGNTLDVNATVTNTGDESGTQTVTLDIDNSVEQVDSASVTLSGGGSSTQTLSWAVPSGQTKQDYQATASSADDTAIQTVTVGLIPDSELPQTQHRWVLDAGTGTTWRDAVGSADATANFQNWVSGNFVGGYKTDLNGTGDEADTPVTLPAGSMWLSATVDFSTTKNSFEYIQAVNPSGGVKAGERVLEFDDSGNVEFLVANDSATRTSATSSVSTGTHRFVGYLDTSASEAGIAVDGTIQTTESVSGSFTTQPTNIHGIGYNRAANRDYYQGGLDDVGVGSAAPTSTDIQNDYTSQPWS